MGKAAGKAAGRVVGKVAGEIVEEPHYQIMDALNVLLLLGLHSTEIPKMATNGIPSCCTIKPLPNTISRSRSGKRLKRTMNLWKECKPSDDQILSEAHSRCRKKWRSIYSSSGDIQLPVRSKAAVDDRYPHSDFKSLTGRITAMTGELHGITNGTTECARLRQAIS